MSSQTTEKTTAGLYAIENFSTARGGGMGQYGFGIVLDGIVVKHLLATERIPDAPLITALQDNLVKSLPAHSDPSIGYYENTWLLTNMEVGGQCACFFMESRQYLKSTSVPHAVRYSPHNIDTPQQAAAILSTWLCWFNHVLPTFTPYQLPFCM